MKNCQKKPDCQKNMVSNVHKSLIFTDTVVKKPRLSKKPSVKKPGFNCTGKKWMVFSGMVAKLVDV